MLLLKPLAHQSGKLIGGDGVDLDKKYVGFPYAFRAAIAPKNASFSRSG
jgi:hypothetical protein